jgi:phage gp29-like protein
MAKAPKKTQGKQIVPITDRIATVSLLDRYSTYPSKGLTPERLASLLREADAGDVYRQMELFEEMLEKDGHLQSLFQARRLAVSRRNYNIIAASEDQADVDIADAVDKMIKKIKGWKNGLNDILDCVPKGFSVNQLFWAPKDNQFIVERLRHEHQKKFRFGRITDLDSDPEELRLLVDPRQIESFRGLVPDSELSHATTEGISLEADPQFRRRFIVAYCKARSGNPSRTSLLRTCTYLFLFKNYDIKWWISFAEKLLGYVIGKYDPSQPDQKDLLIKAVTGLATDAAAVITKDSEIEFAEMAQKAASHMVYRDIKDWANSEMSEVVLGHTGTTTGTPGKLGQEDMAKEVKRELVEADAQVVDEAISDDLIRPFVDYTFGPQDEYPYYQTDLSQALDLFEEAQIDRELQAMGFPISKKYVKEKYGRPLPDPKDKEDEILAPVSPPNPFLRAKSTTIVADSKKKLLTGR